MDSAPRDCSICPNVRMLEEEDQPRWVTTWPGGAFVWLLECPRCGRKGSRGATDEEQEQWKHLVP